ncbi:AER213Cp [Eremothecium gossypii ATCC 10895]|uniref:AER213Cp n=1 Tax=Eremothecium gossypii (strain ATCC 10895 / CBS 109.51 / FGSC 9923 / NRRL Y-1056) TaxID=284811 RepID=Q756P1_EREGS|nr:AER213Cp [Eremothecium gossypii ATCC 10895]AAS52894.1 AER213Cp [Eremothecium gossypii ATCC 10895]
MTDPNAARNAVIEIESDPEEDQRIINQYRQTRLVPDRRLNRPRDAANRFVSVSGRVAAAAGEGDDEVEIVNEVYLDDEGPIDSTADFVDLDEQQGPSSSMVINHDGGGDDDVAIIEERTTHPTFLLNLPNGQTLRISGSVHDRPLRRSFETQRTARANMLRRAARSAQRLFMNENDGEPSEREASDREYLPQSVLRQRQQALMQERLQRQREHARQHEHIADPQVDALAPELRSIFYHAETLHEVRTMLNASGLGTSAAAMQDLLQLYMQFRSRQINNWARQRAQEFRHGSAREADHAQDDSASRARLRNPALNAQRRNSFTSYVLARSLGGFGVWPNDFFGDDDEVTQNIIDIIQAREERDLDSRKRKYMEDTKSQQQAFVARAQRLPEGYYASFDPTPKMKMTLEKNGKTEEVVVADDLAAKSYVEVPVCCLCGVELGLGIPDDFAGISAVDRGVSFESLVSKYDFHCPYQALAHPSIADRDLSRKTFVAHCGHTFCGRCFARINNAKRFSKISKKRLAELHGPSHPDNYGPRVCPAEGCRGQLRTRGKMREVFF